MKATEIKLEQNGYNMMYVQKTKGEHNSLSITLGRLIPTHKAQALKVARAGISPDVLNMNDVRLIEEVMNEFGFEGRYKYTKSKSWVRLQNYTDWHSALKLKYGK